MSDGSLSRLRKDRSPSDPVDVAAAFPEDIRPKWLTACRRLAGAGYGETVASAYVATGPAIARMASPLNAVDLADTVSSAAIKSGRKAAALVPHAAVIVAGKVGEHGLRRWLRLIDQAIGTAPESIATILEQTEMLLGILDLDALESWLRIGFRFSEEDPKRRLSFFNLENPAGRRWLQQASGEPGYADFEARLRPFLTALWGDHPPLRETPPNAPEQARRRSGFDGGIVRMPSAYPGFQRHDVENLYLAASAHVAAHLRFSRVRFPVGGLKPTQIALVSLIEDARVERLAIREMPGLSRLFLPFHTVEARSTALTAPALFARLSRALADPTYEDSDPWVGKGRDAFFDAEPEWENQSISRGIGDLLGNDIGQMRIRFDPKSYMVQPAYRDDNLALWDFGDDDMQTAESEQVMSTARVRRQDSPDQTDRIETETSPEESAGTVRVNEQPADGVLVARYPEFDYVIGREQPGWTSVKEYEPKPGASDRVALLRAQRAGLAAKLKELIRSARVSRAERLRGQPEGEFLDLDACIDAAVSRRIGEQPNQRIHGRYERRSRDLSVLLLLDVSQSTSERVRDGNQTVLDVERQATALLSQAMSDVGDPFALAAFCSDRRDDVRYLRLKDFGEDYGELVEARLAGLRSGLSTRLGAAIRHAAVDLGRQRSHRRLLMIVTDGEPSDIDVQDRRYLVEDARRAVQALAKSGIDTFCVGLDSDADSYLAWIFGQRNAITIASVEKLTELLPRLYITLSH
jgi:hypothetical protein